MGDAETEAPWSEWLAAELGCVVVAPTIGSRPKRRIRVLSWTVTLPEVASRSIQAARCRPQTHRRIRRQRGRRSRRGTRMLRGTARKSRSASKVAISDVGRSDRGHCRSQSLCGRVWLDDRRQLLRMGVLAGRRAWPFRCIPTCVPARANDLAGLPPTYIWVGALDLFVDESFEYARRLVRAGVPTELHVYPGVTHVNVGVTGRAEHSLSRAGTLRALKRALRA